MTRRQRLDAELVRRNLARSRQHAAELVSQGRVLVGGQPVSKPATQVDLAVAVTVAEAEADQKWVSRGAHKLLGALDAFPEVTVRGRRCLDAGASTGGFTDVLLDRGAAHVVAVDVGYGQLAWRLRSDARVTVLDRTNVRSLDPEQVAPAPQLVVGDLSFISLRLVLPALARCSSSDADLVLMVKPQFEVGRAGLGSGGVVRDAALRVSAVVEVAESAASLGLGLRGVVASPLPGPSGNVEYFVWLRHEPATTEPATTEPATTEPATTEPATTEGAPVGSGGPDAASVRALVARAVADGPQDGLSAGVAP